MNKTALSPDSPLLSMSMEELIAHAQRAQKGDESALPILRELLKEPTAVDALGGDLAEQVQRTLIEKFSGKDLLVKETVARKLELLRAELAGASSTPLELLLVERAVACWLHLHVLEMAYARNDSMPLELHYQKCLDRAQSRYLAAIKSLALVRRLAVPLLASPRPVPAALPPPKTDGSTPLPDAIAQRLAGPAATSRKGPARNSHIVAG